MCPLLLSKDKETPCPEMHEHDRSEAFQHGSGKFHYLQLILLFVIHNYANGQRRFAKFANPEQCSLFTFIILKNIQEHSHKTALLSAVNLFSEMWW
jgi:hypothetical protein